MAAVPTEADITKVKNFLRSQGIKLWRLPYSNDDGSPGQEAINNIVKNICKDISLSEDIVWICINNLRKHSVERLEKKKENIVKVKIKCSQRQGSLNQSDTKMVEVRLDSTGEDLKSIVSEILGIQEDIKLICSGRVVENNYSLQSQRIQNNSVILCLVIDKLDREDSSEIEKVLNEVKRARRGAELLANAGEDDDGGYDISIEDQKGQALDIPSEEKRALTIALGLHEKGRTILKRKEYELALLLLLEADKEFEECRSEILGMVDNYAVLCLDIVWCYVCSKNIAALPDARVRLEKCENSFKKTYGESLQRLLAIKGSSGNEISLFVRLYVLQAVVNYHDQKFQECSMLLEKAQGYAKMIIADEDKVMEMMSLGLSAREARRALRMNMMNVTVASQWAFKQREEHQEIKKREKERRRVKKMQKEFGACANGDPVNIDSYEQLVDQMGFDPDLVAEALKQTNNEVNAAIETIGTQPELLREAANDNKKRKKNKIKQKALSQLQAMGFDESVSKICLDHFCGEIKRAAEYLANNSSEIPAQWIEAFQNRNNGEGTSSKFTEEEMAMMDNVAQDVTQKQDEYLDVMLDEEMNLIQQYRAMLTSVLQH